MTTRRVNESWSRRRTWPVRVVAEELLLQRLSGFKHVIKYSNTKGHDRVMKGIGFHRARPLFRFHKTEPCSESAFCVAVRRDPPEQENAGVSCFK